MNAPCQMTGLSRAGYYRWLARPSGDAVEMELRDAMQQIALEFPAYGYRRITAELRRRGFQVNHKRVLRLMRQDNLLCLRHKSFVVTTAALTSSVPLANPIENPQPRRLPSSRCTESESLPLSPCNSFRGVASDTALRLLISFLSGRNQALGATCSRRLTPKLRVQNLCAKAGKVEAVSEKWATWQ